MANSTSSKSTPNPSEQLCATSAQLPKTTSCQIKPATPSTQPNAESNNLSTTPLTKESLKKLQSQEHAAVQSQYSSSRCDDDDDDDDDAMKDDAILDNAMGESDVEDIASKILTDATPETRGVFELAQGCLDESNRILLGKRKREDARDLTAATGSDGSEPETTHKRVRRPYFPSSKKMTEAAILVEATRKLIYPYIFAKPEAEESY
ncbi:hypothetical protein EDD21DRAFT_449433 [Dissophora ornata]|nr:hypothetical protein EDD21DRAFT_449433 [Dissophora ornata]